VTFLDCGPSYIVTPKYDGDLLDLPYNEDLFISSHRQMVNALSILHREFIVHSDIHPKNIFWHKTKRSRVDNIMTFGIIFVLGDFEFSKLFDPFPTTLPKSYGQRIHIIKDELCFLDVREYILVSCKKQNKCKKYITSINDLLNTIPVDYHEDLLQLKRCYFKYDKFKRTEYYEKFIRSFRTFSFEKAFVTKRKELFLAEYLLDYINTWHR
jgi:Serine/threonine protein kinase